MNILQISTIDTIGQGFNGLLLSKLLENEGHKANLAVNIKLSNLPNVFQIGNEGVRNLNSKFAELEKELSLHNILPISSLSILNKPWFKEADVIHLQLIQSAPFFSLFLLPIISKLKPTILTIHDLWFATGHCIYPLDCIGWQNKCINCPDIKRLFPLKSDLANFNWNIKKNIYSKSNFEIVVSTQWLLSQIKQNQLFIDKKINLIPFGYDNTVFKVLNKHELRKKFNISKSSVVIFFRNLPESPFKGVPHILKALELINPKKDICVITVHGKGGLEHLGNKFKIIEMGLIESPNEMAELFNVSDIFLMPSEAETFGMMALESIACGTPVIVFEGTAVCDVIKPPLGGLAARYNNTGDLVSVLNNLIENSEFRYNLSKSCVKVAEQYTLNNYLNSHKALYEKAIKDFNVY